MYMAVRFPVSVGCVLLCLCLAPVASQGFSTDFNLTGAANNTVNGMDIDSLTDATAAATPDSAVSCDACPVSNPVAIPPQPEYLMRVSYHKVGIPVYALQNQIENSMDFYYAPVLLVDPSTVTTVYNPFTNNTEVVIPVQMWDESMEKAIQSTLSANFAMSVLSGSTLQVFPIEQIALNSERADDNYAVISDWRSYRNQPYTFTFRAVCLKLDTCDQVARNIQTRPDSFAADVDVSYYVDENANSAVRFQPVLAHLGGRLNFIRPDSNGSSNLLT